MCCDEVIVVPLRKCPKSAWPNAHELLKILENKGQQWEFFNPASERRFIHPAAREGDRAAHTARASASPFLRGWGQAYGLRWGMMDSDRAELGLVWEATGWMELVGGGGGCPMVHTQWQPPDCQKKGKWNFNHWKIKFTIVCNRRVVSWSNKGRIFSSESLYLWSRWFKKLSLCWAVNHCCALWNSFLKLLIFNSVTVLIHTFILVSLANS